MDKYGIDYHTFQLAKWARHAARMRAIMKSSQSLWRFGWAESQYLTAKEQMRYHQGTITIRVQDYAHLKRYGYLP